MSRDRRATPRVLLGTSDKTPEEQRVRLQEEWEAVAERRAALDRLEMDLASRTPGDVAHIIRKSQTVHLPSKYVWGIVVAVFTVVGAAVSMYWKADSHMEDGRIHILEKTGVPVAVERRYETAEESEEARRTMIRALEGRMATQHEELKDDLVKAITPPAKYRRWKANQKRRSASTGSTPPPG